MKLASIVVVMSVVGSSAAYAQGADAAGAPAAPAAAPAAPVSTTTSVSAPAETSGPKLTVMWAPIMLVVPVGEITIEYRAMKKLGVSVELGYGNRTVSDANTDYTGKEIEAGGQVRYYALGDFHKGLELGAQVLEENVKFKDLPANIAAAAGGFTVGPFIGYKVAAHFGFTFEAQLGARYLLVEPAIQGNQSVATPMDLPKWGPLLHLNLGWSF